MTEMKVKEDMASEVGKAKPKNILKLSASSLKTYDQCQLKYYYNYIERLQKKQWDHFDLGNICHKVLEIFHRTYMDEGNAKGSLNKLMTYSFEKGIAEFPKVSDAIVLEAKDLLRSYLKGVSQSGMPLVKGVETSFEIQLEDDLILRGFLDRVDIMKDGKFHIVDYKTTKSAQYLDPFQLKIYGLWLQEEYGEVDVFKASYVLLRQDSKTKAYDFNRDDLIQCRKKIYKFAESIQTSMDNDLWKPSPCKLCNWCDFKDICPTQQAW